MTNSEMKAEIKRLNEALKEISCHDTARRVYMDIPALAFNMPPTIAMFAQRAMTKPTTDMNASDKGEHHETP
ncbi:MAG: hypothetical protein JEY79_17250 [Pseudodesulfovibrio sp.]|nr:hypothetical protein [Pseudodesulfovibrio sp.]